MKIFKCDLCGEGVGFSRGEAGPSLSWINEHSVRQVMDICCDCSGRLDAALKKLTKRRQ